MNVTTTAMTASNQWVKRPSEERFTSLDNMLEACQKFRAESVTRSIPNRDMKAAPIDGDRAGLAILCNGLPSIPTHHAFTQMAQLVGAPAGYLRTLPAEMVADLLNFGLLKQREVQEVGTLTNSGQDSPVPMLMAATGPNYGRIWNDDVIASLIDRFGNGTDGDFTVPGEFGKAVDVDKGNTTLYRSDRDMFVFLADEKHRIDIPNRRNGKPGSLARGFFLWNSEVGAASLGIATFLFDYVCCNRIVWGMTEHKEVRLRHSSGAPHRWLEEVAPALEVYAQSSTKSITDAIEAAQNKRIAREPEEIDKFLKTRFTASQTAAIKLAHEAEEQRPIETIWDAVTGATAYAKGLKFQDSRVDVERTAGRLLDLVS